MAKLKACKHCKQQIAKTCKICPHCGGKNKTGIGCGGLILFVVLVFGFFAVGVTQKKNHASEVKQKIEEQQAENIAGIFSELGNDPEISKYSVTQNKISIVYKNDPPENVWFILRSLASRGSKHMLGSSFTAECSVEADPDLILHEETREKGKTTSIAYKANRHAKDAACESARIAAAREQVSVFRQGKTIDQFREKFMLKSGECIPVMEYIRRNAHDPDSIEHVRTSLPLPENGMFFLEVSFRGKNIFGKKVLTRSSFLVSPDGKTVIPKE